MPGTKHDAQIGERAGCFIVYQACSNAPFVVGAASVSSAMLVWEAEGIHLGLILST
jgi:hypothetical protein